MLPIWPPPRDRQGHVLPRGEVIHLHYATSGGGPPPLEGPSTGLSDAGAQQRTEQEFLFKFEGWSRSLSDGARRFL